MAAVSGSKSTTLDKVEKNNCSPCEDGKLIIEATMFCGHCKEYMCTSCSRIHRSFKQSRGHNLVSISEPCIPSQGQAVCVLSFSSCAEHGDRDMDLFCENHEVVLCDSCKIKKHRKCNVVSVSGMKNDDNVNCKKQLTDGMETIRALTSIIDKLKQEKENDIESLNSAEKSCLAEIKIFKTEVIQMVERLESKLIEKAKNAVATEMAILQSHVQMYDVLISEATVATKEANSVQSIHESLMNVIAVNKLRTTRHNIELTLSEIQTEAHTFNITFFPSLILPDFLTSPDQLGTLYVPHSVSVSGTCNVSASAIFTDIQLDYSREIKTSLTDITSSAVLPNGDVILTNNSNASVILLDKTFIIKSTLKLPTRPWDVASYEENVGGIGGGSRAIVSMPEDRQLQWIDYTDVGLRLGSTITNTYQCYGIAVHTSEIYVGSVDVYGIRYVQVMDRGGIHTRTINSCSSYMHYITVSSNGTVYMSDCSRNGILYFTTTGDGKYKEQHIAMKQPRGMLLDGEDNLLVCCEGSNDIHVLEKDGKHRNVFLSSKDCLSKPRTMWYRQVDKTLVVVNATGWHAFVFK